MIEQVSEEIFPVPEELNPQLLAVARRRTSHVAQPALTAALKVLDFTYYLIIFSTMETMRTTEPISVTLPAEMLKRARKLAARENRTMSELVREALRRYEQGAQAPAAAPQQALREFMQAVAAFRVTARREGLDKLSMSDINKEIAAARKNRQGRLATSRSAK